MKLRDGKLTEKHAKELSAWKYEGEYKLYNLPDWQTMINENYALCDEIKRNRFIAYTNENNELLGFISLLNQDVSVFLGIGVKPKYCNQGISKEILKLALKKYKEKFPNKSITLEVRTWNKRAINCYKAQGFQIIDTKYQETYLGFGEFYIMIYK